MKTPLAFIEDSKLKNRWHICNHLGTLCGDPGGGMEWHLPDQAFLKINLCLTCWEVLSEFAAGQPRKDDDYLECLCPSDGAPFFACPIHGHTATGRGLR